MNAFSDPQAVARYVDGPPRMVPGYVALQRMAMLLLAERAADDSRILVLGAGGGLEMKVLAEAHPKWRIDGVDPSAAMLDLARQTLGPSAKSVVLHEGLIDVAPLGPYDGATCILTLHFLARQERLRTLRELHGRLRPGAPLVVAHFSFPQEPDERNLWLSRYAAFAVASGMEPVQMAKARAGISESLPILSPREDEELLCAAGFSDVTMFYMGFTFRGWVAYA